MYKGVDIPSAMINPLQTYHDTFPVDSVSVVRFSRKGKMARSILIATGNITRKDSATWPANTGLVSDPNSNIFSQTVDIVSCVLF